jgi:hypothetical protein
MNPRHTTLLLSILLLAACNNKPVKPLPVSTPFQPSPSDSIYSSIRPTVQQFTIDAGTAKVITAAGGTSILVPAGCFLNAAGEPVKGNVQLELVEAGSLQDFISGGLTTVSDGKLLISNGMMYLNAKANGEQLQLDKNNPLTVNMPTMGSNNGGDAGGGFQMFMGNAGNWQTDSTMTEEPDYAITLPLNLLYQTGYITTYNFTTVIPDKPLEFYLLDTLAVNLLDKKYENTAIATVEFKSRTSWLELMTEWISCLTRSSKASQKEKSDYFDLALFKEYLDHPYRSFRETDSIVKQIYSNYFKENKTRLERYCDSSNKALRIRNSYWTDTDYYFDFRKESLEQHYMRWTGERFFSGKKSIRQFDAKGVDLNNPDAFSQLLQKGVAVKEINEMLRYNFQRNNLIRQLKQQIETAAAKDKLQKMYQSTEFSVTRMGWINCDRFYDDPKAGKAEIYVSNSSGTPLHFMDCSLVIPSLNVRLAAWQTPDGRYSFTQKDGIYIKLPIGTAAVVVGTSLENNNLYYASQKITIKDGISLNLPMKQIAANLLADSLKAVVKN